MKKVNKTVSMDRAFDIIKKPITTEKSTNLMQYNQYCFIVSSRSNSYEIKDAIEKIFKVKVLKINTSITRGKLKSFKNTIGYRKDYKKAIVTLKEGNTIDTSMEIK